MAYELNERAATAKRRFEIPVLIAALLIVPVIIVESREPSETWLQVANIANWAIWAAFFVEYVTVVALADDRAFSPGNSKDPGTCPGKQTPASAQRRATS